MIRWKMMMLAAACSTLAAGCTKAPAPTPPPAPAAPTPAAAPGAKQEKVEPVQSTLMQP